MFKVTDARQPLCRVAWRDTHVKTCLGAHGDEERMADGRDDLTREGDPELGVGLQPLLV